MKSTVYKYTIGISAILALALAGGAAFKLAVSVTIAWDYVGQIF